ncbi:UBA-e1-C domain-containing protein [Favolaschia claudopus]|uniref:UBA-e1-C domain-containing protein n=1 Tax=Favolaschia claudopus TaxID=2862362 RepID=A0AAV9ZGX0_9AGAR
MSLRLFRSLNPTAPAQNTNQLVPLVKASLIPLHVVLVGLTWILHDYFLTLEDEPQRRSFSKFIIALLLFDVVQIHVFARPGITSDNVCIAMDTIIRIVGAVSLWSVEIIMQLRIYALFECSKPIAFLNLTLFAGSIAGFMWILVHNHSRRASVIADVIDLPLPGCPSVHSGIEWAQWVPATIFEGILFSFALFKTFERTVSALRKEGKVRLYRILLRDNILYFFGVAALLVFNNSVTHIPWFSYGPFHAAVGIMTSRMLINLRKVTSKSLMISAGRLGEDGETLRFTDSSTL